MLVTDDLDRLAGSTRTVAIVGDKRMSYAELWMQSRRLAEGVRSSGVMPGDRVVMMLPNGLQAVVAIYGAQYAGATVCPLPAATTAASLASVIRDCTPTALLCEPKQRELVSHTMSTLERDLRPNVIVSDGVDDPRPGGHPAPRWTRRGGTVPPVSGASPLIDRDPAFILYTSGSSGDPKGVVLSHLGVRSTAESIISYSGLTRRDRVLCVMPFAYGYGLYQLLTAVATGGSLIVETTFAFPHVILARAAHHGVTGLCIVPSMAAGLRELKAVPTLPTLRFIHSSGATLHSTDIAWIRGAFPRVALFSAYGLTECQRVLCLPPEEIERRPGSVGKPVPNVHAEVIDETGLAVGAGEVGELVVRSTNVMQGYWNDLPGTRRVLSITSRGDPLLRTGDSFRTDDEGFFYFLERRDRLFKTQGFRVSPAEIERALLSVEGVREAAVVAVDHPRLGKEAIAYVRVSAGTAYTEPALRQRCLELLEPHKVPRRIHLVRELPRTTSGKVSYRDLTVEVDSDPVRDG